MAGDVETVRKVRWRCMYAEPVLNFAARPDQTSVNGSAVVNGTAVDVVVLQEFAQVCPDALGAARTD